jgi:hypothetical protein
MKLIWRLNSLNKYNNWIFKLAIAVLLLGFAFRFFFYQSSSFEPNIETPFVDSTELSKEPVPSVEIPKPPPPVTVDIPKPPASVNTSETSLSSGVQEHEDETPQEGNKFGLFCSRISFLFPFFSRNVHEN